MTQPPYGQEPPQSPYGQGQYGQGQYGQGQYGQGQYPQQNPQQNPQPQYGGQQYPQQQYGQGQEGQQPQHYQPYSQAAAAYGAPVGSGAKFGVVGVVFAGIGAIVLIIAFTAVNWAKVDNTGFSDLHDSLSAAANPPGLANAYFSYLGWLLIAICVVVAIGANLPSPASGPLRALAAVLAVLGIVLTIFAIKNYGDASFGDVFKNTRAGFYMTLIGFLIVGIGGLIGPQRTRSTVAVRSW